MRRIACATLLVALALPSAGCFDIREDVHVRADGTARYDLDLAMPEMFFAFMASADTSGGNPADRLFGKSLSGAATAGDSTRTREFVEGDMHHFAMERDLRSIEQLPAIAATDSTGNELRGRALPGYALVRLDANRVRLTRALDPDSTDRAKLLGGLGSGDDSTDAGMGSGLVNEESARRMFAGRTYTLRIHAPRVESANGTIAADGKSVEWKLPITGLFSADSLRSLEAVFRTR
jgi:hypothetical protein